MFSNVFAADEAVFSFPIAPEAKIEPAKKAATIQSQEYWFDVTGSALSKGVSLKNTAPGALVLITQKHGDDDSALLDVEKISLLTDEGRPIVSKKVSQAQLEQTGFFAKSVALQAKEGKGTGVLMLKSSQSLAPEFQYRVMVKEPKSPYSLSLKADSQSISAEKKNLGSAALKFDGGELDLSQMKGVSYQAELKAVDGTTMPVTVSRHGNQVFFSVEDMGKTLSPREGLYELVVTANTQAKGMIMQRNAKVALAISQPTANIEGARLSGSRQPEAVVDAMIHAPGRYEVRAVLYATDKKGEFVPVMETHSATDANVGLEQIKVPFDQTILAKSGLSAPYQVRHVRLFDQGQLALLDESDAIYQAATLARSGGR